jgi:hypothetical protein
LTKIKYEKKKEISLGDLSVAVFARLERISSLAKKGHLSGEAKLALPVEFDKFRLLSTLSSTAN